MSTDQKDIDDKFDKKKAVHRITFRQLGFDCTVAVEEGGLYISLSYLDTIHHPEELTKLKDKILEAVAHHFGVSVNDLL